MKPDELIDLDDSTHWLTYERPVEIIAITLAELFRVTHTLLTTITEIGEAMIDVKGVLTKVFVGLATYKKLTYRGVC